MFVYSLMVVIGDRHEVLNDFSNYIFFLNQNCYVSGKYRLQREYGKNTQHGKNLVN